MREKSTSTGFWERSFTALGLTILLFVYQKTTTGISVFPVLTRIDSISSSSLVR
jgi:hypothetical protein